MTRPAVLCVVDRPGWAHDRKTDALARELRDGSAGGYEIVKRFQSDLTADDLARADGVLLYYWHQAERLRPLRDELRRLRGRLMIGICSHVELAEEWRTPGLATLAELAGAVFVNNRRLRDEFGPALGALGKSVFYTPNGVDTEFFRPAAVPRPPSPTLRVGWAGSLDNQGAEHRGVHEILAPAVAALPGAELCLAAREETWRGPEEMLAFYRSLDVYVCASRSEGTPNPCLEAAACGVPLITTPVGNMPELIRDGENGFFIERNVASLTEKLARLRADPDLRERVGQAARATVVESWDWRRQAARYGAMFREVLGERVRAGRRLRLLIEPEHVAIRIGEARRDLRSVRPQRLHDAPAVRDDRLEGRLDAVDHDVEQEARRGRRGAAGDPGAAHLAHAVVERGGAVAPLADRPAEHRLVEADRPGDVVGGNLEITDLAVCTRRSHRESSSEGRVSLLYREERPQALGGEPTREGDAVATRAQPPLLKSMAR